MRPLYFINVMLSASVLVAACSYSQPSNVDDQSGSECELSSEAADLIDMINTVRAEVHYCGRSKLRSSAPLRSNCALQSAAQEHAKTLAETERLSHKGEGNSTLAARVDASGYRWSAVGENIAKGQTTSAALLDDWLVSRKHCENLSKGKYQDIGVGRVGLYWVAVFAVPE